MDSPRPDEAYQLGLQLQQQVLDHSPAGWRPSVLAYVTSLPIGTVCTGESIRLECLRHGLKPHHPNAWGAVIKEAIRQGLLKETGRFPRMRALSSHGRRNPEYLRIRTAADPMPNRTSRRLVTPEALAQARRLLDAGNSLTAVANTLGFNRQTIANRLNPDPQRVEYQQKRARKTMRELARGERKLRNPPPPHIQREIALAYRSGASLSQLAAAYHHSTAAIRGIIHSQGVMLRPPGGRASIRFVP